MKSKFDHSFGFLPIGHRCYDVLSIISIAIAKIIALVQEKFHIINYCDIDASTVEDIETKVVKFMKLCDISIIQIRYKQ